MNYSASGPSVSPETTSSSKLVYIQNKNKDTIHEVITINEKVNLTKQ